MNLLEVQSRSEGVFVEMEPLRRNLHPSLVDGDAEDCDGASIYLCGDLCPCPYPCPGHGLFHAPYRFHHPKD